MNWDNKLQLATYIQKMAKLMINGTTMEGKFDLISDKTINQNLLNDDVIDNVNEGPHYYQKRHCLLP